MLVCGRRARAIGKLNAGLRRSLSSSHSAAASSAKPFEQKPTQRDAQGRLLSRVSGPTDRPLSKETLGQFWNGRVAQFGHRPALIVRHEPADQHGSQTTASESESCIRWTFEQMDDHVRQLVRGMRGLGVKKGDRVAVLMMNNSAMASLQIATALVGAILVTLNPSYTTKQLLSALNHVDASFLFIVPSLRSSNYIENLCSILPSLSSSAPSLNGDRHEINDEKCPSLRRIVLLDNLSNRPGSRWSSESILGRTHGFTFKDALDKLNNHAIDYRELLIAHDQGDLHADEQQGLKCNDIVNLQLTSGTTGAPKAVALSSHNLVNNGLMLSRIMRLSSDDILTNVPPLFHCFGLTLGNLATWSAGACILYPAEGFNAVRALRAASEEGATAIHGVPAHFIAELDVLRRVRAAERSGTWDRDLSQTLGIDQSERWTFNLRTGFTSGSTVPIELMHAIMDPTLLGAKEQTVVYGMTETSPVSFGCDTGADVALRCETVGRVVEHVHAKIVSPDDEHGTALAVGQVGELCTGGYVVMDGGYWQDKAKTDEVLQIHADEPDIVWMRTGDLAVINEQGYTEIRGRVKDMIIRGGENLTATGIENCIDTLAGVASSAAVAVPDDKMGETVGVFISRMTTSDPQESQRLTPACVRAHVKEAMSGQNAPDWVWFMGQDDVPNEMPTTASGKVQKVILRQWARDLVQKGVGRAKRQS